ncbi:hypothetical protein HDV00_004193 [Rhizophlyctis rosea]|nr:hypothetical protein HDV00_004193 [Rhizophlyctis rosea]
MGLRSEHDVTGKGLAALSNDTLKDLGITSTAKRIKIMSAIQELKTCSAAFYASPDMNLNLEALALDDSSQTKPSGMVAAE